MARVREGITRAEVRHVARLARLELTEADVERMRHELDGVLALIDEVRRVDVGDLAPMEHVASDTTTLRPDEPVPSLGRDALALTGRLNDDGLLGIPPITELGS